MIEIKCHICGNTYQVNEKIDIITQSLQYKECDCIDNKNYPKYSCYDYDKKLLFISEFGILSPPRFIEKEEWEKIKE